jgi:putative FmdB family regulatory protein
MPIFEYVCKECGHPFEKIVPRYDSAVECDKCHSVKVEKQLSVFAVAGSSSSSSSSSDFPEAGCGRCGASQPGSCGLD